MSIKMQALFNTMKVVLAAALTAGIVSLMFYFVSPTYIILGISVAVMLWLLYIYYTFQVDTLTARKSHESYTEK